MWTCPGDFGAKRGIYTPAWYKLGSQHGLLKTLAIDKTGTYMDGIKLSEVSITDIGIMFGSEISLRIASREDAANCGGVTLFGRQFGNYPQDIEVWLHF